jgi:hypothetical protein
MNDFIREAIDRLRRVNAGERPVAVYQTQEPPPHRLGKWSEWDAIEWAKSRIATDNENVADYYISILDEE